MEGKSKNMYFIQSCIYDINYERKSKNVEGKGEDI